jgi:uncharacterized protein (TIGR00266 family)
MNPVIKGGQAFAALRVDLQPGENIKAEKNAMVAMSGDLKLSAKVDGGFLRGIARKFSGESFFFQNISADKKPGWVMLAPQAPGGITSIELNGKVGITAEKGAFLAATNDITISSKVQRLLKAMFSSDGLIVVKIGGSGTVFLSAFGAIETISLLPEQNIIVDNTHLMAWEDSVTYTLGKGGTSWMSAGLGGEGIVAHMKGPGRVWVQTRTAPAFRNWLGLNLEDNSGNT